MRFSVLMSVYKNERVDYFRAAVDSVLGQTLLPDEIILVRDGPVSDEMQAAIDDYVQKNKLFHYIPLEQNGGLGNALNIGLQAAQNEIVARMDTDDICVEDRFERQMRYFEAHPDVAVCGGQILEFIDSPEELVCKREVPTTHEAIRCFMCTRNSFNHMTVMFRKSAVMAAGNYIDLYFMEDYYLWCRMLLQGAVFGNMEDVLVYARIGKDMFRRRGGYKYFKSWLTLEKFKLRHHMTGRMRYIRTVTMRFVVHVLLPNRVRGWVLKTFSRRQTVNCKP